jgi:hypothetical protein
MGNAAIAEELPSLDELDELYQLNASESEPEDDDEDDLDDDDLDDDDFDDPFKLDGGPAPARAASPPRRRPGTKKRGRRKK